MVSGLVWDQESNESEDAGSSPVSRTKNKKMMIEHLEINNYKTVIIHPSKTSKEYTIYSNDEKGVVIINDENRNCAIEKYTKAIQLLSVIQKFFLYSSLYKRMKKIKI